MIGIDFIFSYWVFLLFIFYYITKLSKINPFLLLSLVLTEQLLALLYYLYIGLPIATLAIYAFIIVIIKVIPLYLIRNSKHKWNPVFSLSFFLIYLLYLHYNGTNFIEVYKKVNTSMINGTNDTPFFYYLKKIGINPS
jgi:hypothetical protein